MLTNHRSFNESTNRYSIRKTHWGAAAVLIGIFLSGAVLSTPVVHADGEVAASTATVSTNSDLALLRQKM